MRPLIADDERMTWYADAPTRRTRQVLGDLLTVAWIGTSVWAARLLHDAVAALRSPADALAGAGQSLSTGLTNAGQQLGRIPGVGDGLQSSFGNAAGTGTQITQVGTDLAAGVDRLALIVGLVTAALPILIAVLVWLRVRWRFVRTATASKRFIDAAEDLDLFALRALTGQPMARLARISDDPAGAWRRRDPQIVRALAALELRDAGLPVPGTKPRLSE